MDTFGHEQSHLFKDPGAVANGLAGIRAALIQCTFVFILDMNTLRFFKATTDKNQRIQVQGLFVSSWNTKCLRAFAYWHGLYR
jgi:hypothetical protein